METVYVALLTLGVLLLLVGIVGQVKAQEIEVGTKNSLARIILGLVGLLFICIALIGTLFPEILHPTPTPTPIPPTSISPTPIPPTLFPPTSIPPTPIPPTSIPPTTPPSPTPTPTLTIRVSDIDGMVQVLVNNGALSFWIDKTEATNRMFKLCVADGFCTNKPSAMENPYMPGYYAKNEFNDYPVVFVNQSDARTYCTWARRRLPTADEWNLAAKESGQGSIDGTTITYYVAGTFDTSLYGVNDMGGQIDEWSENGLMEAILGLNTDYPLDGQNFATGIRCASSSN